jgi:hypothetical protein
MPRLGAEEVTRRRAIWIGVAVAVVGGLTWALWPPSEQPLYDYIAERRAAGLPTTRDEIRGPAPPAAENGAEDLKAAWDALVADFGPESSWKASGFDPALELGEGGGPDALSDEQRADLAKTAERLRPGIEPLVRALDKPRLVWPLTFDHDGWRNDLEPRIELTANVDKALQVQASGDTDPARRLAACRAILAMAQRSERGQWIDWAAAQAFRTRGVAALRDGVESGTVGAADARAACDALLAASPMETFRAAGRAEAVELLETYRAVVEGRAVPPVAKLSRWQRFEHDLQRAARRIAGPANPFDVDFEGGHAELVVAVCRLRDAAAGVPDLRTLTTREGLAAIDRGGLARDERAVDATANLARTAIRAEAALRLARVALAAAEFRATRGDYANSLDDLAPMFADGVPLDPYTDARFSYDRSATEVRIASAGRSARDDPTLREECLVWELRK